MCVYFAFYTVFIHCYISLYVWLYIKRLTVENFDEFDEWLVIRRSFSLQTFISYCFSFETHDQSLSNSYKTHLIFSKMQLAPQYTTIPRFELLGVLIGVRALKLL